ncbi:hypothetical protein CEK26_009864 [Fusarium fujikuroi]|uniref:Uncharacterized protein n=1 Tax=Fusarium fujikuroi TaxID=5127 RepID=A0A0J0ACL3_FUSFU|nr:Uncharacterized protein LW93_1000 [Fusarium fujikuroi]KLP08312.1 Uncharacterized protein Y057_12966 [Fusarium fujikuroi]KLP17662.1 Uncharacterized protein LW94_2393 [Fusarium fujikuroi]QGI65913.1 hypothetical protein CEK27_009884 [Fusarium fujikuroi]QGI83153.1 hypothetical protein CEK25_009882 [Fusarium fujikuroi]
MDLIPRLAVFSTLLPISRCTSSLDAGSAIVSSAFKFPIISTLVVYPQKGNANLRVIGSWSLVIGTLQLLCRIYGSTCMFLNRDSQGSAP